MDKQSVKDVLYGGLLEIVKDPRNFTYIGQVEFSKFSDKGTAAVLELTSILATLMIKADKEDVDRRAKELTMNALKNN